MADLSTKYMGLDLGNPVIVGSSGLTDSVEGVVQCEKAGAGAVVLKSIFEEQILSEIDGLADVSEIAYWHTEAADYIREYGRENAVGAYVDLVKRAKEAVAIPVIASIHCVSPGVWTEFAMRVEAVGADAIELNVHVFPADPLRRSARDNEQVYLEIVRQVKARTKLPVSVKMGSYFSSLPEIAIKLQSVGVDGVVLFNRFFQIDVDIEKLELVPGERLSSPAEIAEPLRWVSILSGLVDYDLAATTGVHDGAGVVKQILAGAAAVEICSALYRHGVGRVAEILREVEDWMTRRGFSTIADFRGRLSQDRSKNPALYERVQFMKTSVGRR
jgi:dihydroorotate dehydrogenase (fumarate)